MVFIVDLIASFAKHWLTNLLPLFFQFAFDKMGSMTTNTITKERKKQETVVMAELDQRIRRLSSLNLWTGWVICEIKVIGLFSTWSHNICFCERRSWVTNIGRCEATIWVCFKRVFGLRSVLSRVVPLCLQFIFTRYAPWCWYLLWLKVEIMLLFWFVSTSPNKGLHRCVLQFFFS